MKFTLKEKLHYVKLHVEENVPIYEIERKYGISASSIKYFCCLYKKYGEKWNFINNFLNKKLFSKMKESMIRYR